MLTPHIFCYSTNKYSTYMYKCSLKAIKCRPAKKYVQSNKCTIQRKFGTSNEQQVSERHLTKKIETKK